MSSQSCFASIRLQWAPIFAVLQPRGAFALGDADGRDWDSTRPK
ncbi:MAG: hypothetical protein K0R79_2024 [Stenotrophomonas indicatrix]|jgi:hypothetical protein|nr:hypothetical protein [Stenotrophomonas indicatrix]